MLDAMYMIATPWATATKRQILKNRILGRIANYLYPIHCKFSEAGILNEIENQHGEEEIIISLTSFPARIEKVYLCINSLLRQSMKPNRIILWLAESQFPTIDSVPESLLKLRGKGLEIRFCDDLRSYKKIFYTAQEFRNSVIITVDDDTLYPESWLLRLWQTHQQHRNCVCCYRAHKITVEDHKIAEYKKWIGLSPNEKGPAYDLIPIGVGGVLYPSGYFKNVVFNFEDIKKLCPTTDDLWLKAIGLANGYRAVKVDSNSKEWFTIADSQKQKLTSENVDTGENDRSMKRLMEFYKLSADKISRGGVRRIRNKISHELLRFRIIYSKWEKGTCKEINSPRIIISLTSYPKRFSKLELCIKSLCLQKVKPNRIILWLGSDSSETDYKALEEKYAKYDVEIRWDNEKNLFSHKKYYYAMQEFPEDIIVTADDDLIYPSDWLESLISTSKKYPECICARRVHEIKWKSDDLPDNYINWPGEVKAVEPSHDLLATTGAGTLFPPNCFSSECFNSKVFMEYARTADDIWLKIMAVLSNRLVVWAPNNMPMPTTIDLHQDEKLEDVNCEGGGNDMIFRKLCEYYKLSREYFEIKKRDYNGKIKNS